MNRYHRYQNVNSYWYDEVPDHWKKTKNKYVFHQDKKVVGSSWEDHVLLTMGKSGVKPRDMEGGGKFPASFENYQVVTPNQIIFCLFDLDETPRTVGKSSDHGMITSAYDVFSTTPENDPQFWTYFYQMIDDHKGLRPYYTGLRKVVRSETFMGIEVFSPPFEEQKLISRYLDKKTSQIDSLVEKIQKKIELLKEQRTSLVNHYVTKGLDPNVEMKDSGVEWIGEIPKHWERIRVKHLVSTKISDGPHETPNFVDEGVPFLSVEGIVNNKIDLTRVRGYITQDLHEVYSKKCKPIKNDILLVKSGSTTGKSTLVDIDVEFNIWSPLCILRSDESKVSPPFLFNSVQSRYFLTQVETNWSYGTQPNIGMGVVEELWVVVPPLEEQSEISKYLRNKIEILDNVVTKQFQKIRLYQEYRRSLISSVVTGKVRVTEDMI